mmetsp:Transcript_57450/g.125832  ORF Transcript_57450/g.125832 Transcript_57450/m.125832 type:complete len:275 (-) Transcript_57450:808-1632(-)
MPNQGSAPPSDQPSTAFLWAARLPRRGNAKKRGLIAQLLGQSRDPSARQLDTLLLWVDSLDHVPYEGSKTIHNADMRGVLLREHTIITEINLPSWGADKLEHRSHATCVPHRPTMNPRRLVLPAQVHVRIPIHPLPVHSLHCHRTIQANTTPHHGLTGVLLLKLCKKQLPLRLVRHAHQRSLTVANEQGTAFHLEQFLQMESHGLRQSVHRVARIEQLSSTGYQAVLPRHKTLVHLRRPALLHDIRHGIPHHVEQESVQLREECGVRCILVHAL